MRRKLKLKHYKDYYPIALKRIDDGYHKYIVASLTSYNHHTTLKEITSSPYFGVVDDTNISRVFRTRDYTIRQYAGILYSEYNNYIYVIIAYNIKDDTLVAFVTQDVTSKSCVRVLNAFIRKHGVKRKNIIYKTCTELSEMFVKTLEFQLEDAYPEEQKKVSSLILNNLRDRYTIK